MSLKDWAEHGWLKPHKTSKEEIGNLLAIVERELKDAAISGLSADARFVMTYNAALKLCTILLSASGYRTGGNRAHYHTLEALPLILGQDLRSDADYLSSCLSKRNHAEYDYVDVVGESDVEELIQATKELKEKVLVWLKKEHFELTK
jgi:hypothetical protein